MDVRYRDIEECLRNILCVDHMILISVGVVTNLLV